MALIHRLGGLPALIIVFAGIVTLTFGLVYASSVGRPYLAAFVTLLGAYASAVTWGARPQMFNMLGLAVFVFVVEVVRDGRLNHRAFLALPFLTALWANLHSGYLLGVVLLGTYVVGETAQRISGTSHSRTLEWNDIRWLGGITVACFGAALLNPNGYRLWIYPFETLTSNAMQSYIQEWHSPDFHASEFWPFGLLLLVGVIGISQARGRLNWTDLLLFLGTGVAALISARHIQIFGIVAVPIVTRYLLPGFSNTRFYPLLAGTQSPPKPSRVLVVLHWWLIISAGLAMTVSIGNIIGKNDSEMAAHFPVDAVDFVEEQGWVERRIYNNYNWGGYLIWRDIPVYVDGRADVYGDQFLNYYLQTFLVLPDWRVPLDEYDVEYVLIGDATPLSVLLTESDDWHALYEDDVAQIFGRGAQ
jgi:hypothetical protein